MFFRRLVLFLDLILYAAWCFQVRCASTCIIVGEFFFLILCAGSHAICEFACEAEVGEDAVING
jgi:hypothetical protein